MTAQLRIVSLLPSATELVCALGLEASLVGRSHECNAPAGIAALPACTRSRVTAGASAEIDADVRRRLAAGEALYEIDAALVRELAPTHIVTQAQCDVCAVSLDDVLALVERGFGGEPPQIHTLAPRTLGDVFADLQRLGDAFGLHEAGRAAAASLADRVSQVGEQTGAGRARPRVLCLEWTDPPIAAGNWMPEIVRVAGGTPLFGRVGEHSRPVAWTDVAAADPDEIVVMPCGFDLERSLGACEALAREPAWNALRAVRSGHVTAVDGDAYFNRSGPRLVDSLELLAEILSPDRFEFGLAARAARRLPPCAG